MRFIVRFIAISLFLVIGGCGSGNNSNGPILTLTSGNWQVNTASTTNPGAISDGGTSLSQTGTSVSGIMHLVSPPCFNPTEDININATVNGPTLQFTSSIVTGQMLSVTATGSDTSLTGSYTMSGTACPQDQGIFTAILVPPATGTWNGTLTSAGGTITQVTATLTQTGPDAQGFFPLSGTVIFSGSCFSSGTVTGEASGAGYALIVKSDRGIIESFVIAGAITDPATANTFAGTYTSTESTCTDSGTVSLNKS
jgi:hypothetical protein